MAADPEGIPSERLIAMFRDCSRDPAENIEARLSTMLQTFLQHFRDNEGNENFELGVKCCRDAKIFYYSILESCSIEERNKLGTSNISGFFECNLFQRCLVVCCLEISIFSNRMPCVFPLVLQIFNMAPYHFWRVIEVVVRAVFRTPAVVKHLAEVEDKVLKSLAWTSDSPLWEDIRANEGRLPTCLQVLPPTQLEEPMTADSQSDRSQPGGLHSGPGPSARANQQRSPSAGNPPQRCKSLHLFTRKVYSLMGRCLSTLCPTLRIGDEQRLKIWTCFEHCLVHCTDLMMNRHLDQILMCTIYIIGKVTDREIPFKEIMKCYKSQPLSSKNVCKNVLISGRDTENCPTGSRSNGEHSHGLLTPNTPSTHSPPSWQEERGNLIYFYNQVYSVRLQHFASQFASTPRRITPPLSPYPRQRRASPGRQRLSSGQSTIFISPFNAETAPRSGSGLRYYFNTSPPELLREINNMIRLGLGSSRGRSAMDRDEEEEEEHPPARRLRLDEETALQRRLRNVENDRLTTRNEDRASPVRNGLWPNMH
ncbi:uncharacterized protein V6R79_007826 [Siganus canaliculatus]